MMMVKMETHITSQVRALSLNLSPLNEEERSSHLHISILLD